MKINANRLEKTTNRIFQGLIFFEIAIVAIYLGSIIFSGIPLAPFDMNGQMTVSSCLQALHLFAIGAIALVMFCLEPRSSARPSRQFMLTIGLLLIFGAVDEMFKIHLKLHLFLPLEKRDWFGIYFGIVASLPVIFFRDFIALWKGYRRETFWGLLGMLIFILGGFGADILNQFVLKPILATLSAPSDSLILLVGSAKIAFEEFAELLGENFILYGVLLFGAKKLKMKDEQSARSSEFSLLPLDE